MTDLEINKALALAIGHPEDDIEPCGNDTEVWVGRWRIFDYRDEKVIAPGRTLKRIRALGVISYFVAPCYRAGTNTGDK